MVAYAWQDLLHSAYHLRRVSPCDILNLSRTRIPVILSSRTKRNSKLRLGLDIVKHARNELGLHNKLESLKQFLKGNILRPLFLLTTKPVVFFFFTLLSGLSYGLLFLATQSDPQVYSTLYDFTETHTGLIQASIIVGEFLGFFACACIEDPYFARESTKSARATGGNPQLLEVRLYLAIPASFLGLAGGLFIYGWTAYADLPYWAPATGLLLVGFGSVVVLQAIMMYITDAYAKYA